MTAAGRFYRSWVRTGDGVRFEVIQGPSDLWVCSTRNQRAEAHAALSAARIDLVSFGRRHPAFLTSLAPVQVARRAPPVVRAMARAARAWSVGPMAAVAGALAESVGRALARTSARVVVENGGDVWARSPRPVRFALWAGPSSPFSDRVRFEVDARAGVGVCTSSAVVGPSWSFGRADAVVAVARDAAAADAAATAVANRIGGPSDVQPVVEAVARGEGGRGGLTGLIACAGHRIGVWGDLRLLPLGGGKEASCRRS